MPGAGSTRWPPLQKLAALGVPACIAAAARDQLAEIRDRADLKPGDRSKVFEASASRVYPRLNAALEGAGRPMV